jgi:hypothetical protein
VTEDRFVIAPLDPTGALVTAVGYETVGAAPRDHGGLPSPFLTFIVTLDTPVVIAEEGAERGLDVVVAGPHHRGRAGEDALAVERAAGHCPSIRGAAALRPARSRAGADVA